MRNLLLYVAIALGIVAVVLILATYVPSLISHGWWIFGWHAFL